MRLFGTSDQIGSATPARERVSRSSSSPPPIVLPAWAITATLLMPALAVRVGGGTSVSSIGRGARRRARRTRSPRARPRPGAGRRRCPSGGACRDTCAPTRRRAGSRPVSPQAATVTLVATGARREHQQQPAVKGECCGRVPRRVARVDRKALQAIDLGAIAVDEQRRRAVCARLDADDEQHEGSKTPATEATNTTRNAPTTTGITTPPASVEPIQDRCSRVGSRWSASHRLMLSSQAANPPIGNSSFVNTSPTPEMRARRAAYPSATAARKTAIGRSAPDLPREGFGPRSRALPRAKARPRP